MNLTELTELLTKENVKCALESGGLMSIEGEDAAVDRVLAQIDRHEIAKLVRQRDGSPEPIVKRVLALNVLSKNAYRENYRSWYKQRSEYYQPSEAEEENMFSVIEEGWEVLFDFAHSVTCRLPNGVLVAVDRRGRITPPSPYSPYLTKVK